MALNCSTQLKKEALASLAACILVFTNGIAIGWTSPAIPSLQQDPIFKHIVTDEIASWIGAMLCLGTILGSLLIPFVLPLIGHKCTLLLFSFPCFIASWILILTAPVSPSIWWFYISRLLMGMGVSSAVCTVPGYIIDIASPQHQGILSLLVNLIYSVGILAVYIIGAVTDWYYLSLICLCSIIPFSVIFPMIPDSPSSLFSRGKHKQARNALKWLNHPQTLPQSQEMTHLPDSTQQMSQSSFQPLKIFEAKNLRPFLVSISMQFTLQFSGQAPLLFFSVSFFRDAKTSVDAFLSSIIVAAIQLGTTLVVGLVASNAPRRHMMLVSQGGMTICHLSMALYFLLTTFGITDGYEWLPLVILILFFIFFNIGVATFVWVITAEVLPPSIRSIANSVAIQFGTIIFFLLTFLFNQMLESWGGFGLFLFYGCSSLFLFLTSIFFLPETREKTTEELSNFFLNYKFPWVN